MVGHGKSEPVGRTWAQLRVGDSPAQALNVLPRPFFCPFLLTLPPGGLACTSLLVGPGRWVFGQGQFQVFPCMGEGGQQGCVSAGPGTLGAVSLPFPVLRLRSQTMGKAVGRVGPRRLVGETRRPLLHACFEALPAGLQWSDCLVVMALGRALCSQLGSHAPSRWRQEERGQAHQWAVSCAWASSSRAGGPGHGLSGR